MTVFEIRQAEEHEAQQIAEVHVAAWKAGYRGLVPDQYLDWLNSESERDRIARRIAKDNTISTFVAVKEDTVLGYASVGPQNEEAQENSELYSIYVHPSCWRGGVGKLLLDRSIEFAKSRGFARLFLSVFEGNARGIQFYETLGFSVHGAREIFAQDNWTLPLIRMVCSLK